MHLRQVTLTVPDPAETGRFLARLFGFPLAQEEARTTVTVGPSALTLIAGPTEPDGYYHLAFDIPENAVSQARDLLMAEGLVLDGGDNGVMTGAPVWNSHSVYFNAPGNLNLELIGRHRLQNAIDRPFTLSDIAKISEVGIAVDDPLTAIQHVQERTGLRPFGEPTETFSPIGSDEGLLILVRHGRIWLPTPDQTTTRRPLRIEIDGIGGVIELGTSCVLIGTDHALEAPAS